jgi:hypothetical protein
VRNLDRYIDELGLEEVAPGIKGVTEISRYQHYMPAADVLAERIGGGPAGRDELLRQMNCALSDGKWPVAVDAIYRNSELPELVPPGDERRVKREIGKAMRAPFRSLPDLETAMPIRNRAMRSAGLGEAAYYEGLRAVTGLENDYRTGSGPDLRQSRQTEQQTPNQQPGHKDVIDIAFSGVVPAGGTGTQPLNLTKPPSTGHPSTQRNPNTRDGR